jgi:hypothetical protein
VVARLDDQGPRCRRRVNVRAHSLAPALKWWWPRRAVKDTGARGARAVGWPRVSVEGMPPEEGGWETESVRGHRR